MHNYTEAKLICLILYFFFYKPLGSFPKYQNMASLSVLSAISVNLCIVNLCIMQCKDPLCDFFVICRGSQMVLSSQVKMYFYSTFLKATEFYQSAVKQNTIYKKQKTKHAAYEN